MEVIEEKKGVPRRSSRNGVTRSFYLFCVLPAHPDFSRKKKGATEELGGMELRGEFSLCNSVPLSYSVEPSPLIRFFFPKTLYFFSV